MMKRRQRASQTSGLPPGTLVHVGQRYEGEAEVTIIDFNDSNLEEKPRVSVAECKSYLESKSISWINIVGLHDVELLKDFGKTFEIHPLVMEDILNTEQRAKTQDFGNYLFVVTKMIRPSEVGYEAEQVSMILKNQCLVTFQERAGDVFDPVRERIRNDMGKVRRSGVDYLLYTLIDAVVDGYYPFLETISDSLESTEEIILGDCDITALQELHTHKRQLTTIRKNIWPMREVISSLERGDSSLVTRSTHLYLKDVHDHIMHILDTIEGQQDVVTGLAELYLSTSSARTNDVMKVLTIIATIFIPLTFIAGIYGMNFVYMPELQSKAGYPIVILLMAAVAIGMIFFFKRKKWF